MKPLVICFYSVTYVTVSWQQQYEHGIYDFCPYIVIILKFQTAHQGCRCILVIMSQEMLMHCIANHCY